MSRGNFFLDDLFRGAGSLVEGAGKGIGTVFEGVGKVVEGVSGTMVKVPTSNDIIKCVRDMGWNITKNLGFDGVNALYLLDSNMVLVINKYVNDDNLRHIRMLQETGELDTDFIIEVYEPLQCGELSFTLVESPTFTLTKYVYERTDLDIEDKKVMVKYIYEDILVIFTYLRDGGYSYVNKSINNFAYRGDHLILMNPAALRETPELNSPDEIARMITREVIFIFDYDKSDVLMDYLDEISGI